MRHFRRDRCSASRTLALIMCGFMRCARAGQVEVLEQRLWISRRTPEETSRVLAGARRALVADLLEAEQVATDAHDGASRHSQWRGGPARRRQVPLAEL